MKRRYQQDPVGKNLVPYKQHWLNYVSRMGRIRYSPTKTPWLSNYMKKKKTWTTFKRETTWWIQMWERQIIYWPNFVIRIITGRRRRRRWWWWWWWPILLESTVCALYLLRNIPNDRSGCYIIITSIFLPIHYQKLPRLSGYISRADERLY